MTEYIERERLLYDFREIMPEIGVNDTADDMYSVAFNAPTADVVEVVRCRHCKHVQIGCGECEESDFDCTNCKNTACKCRECKGENWEYEEKAKCT